MQDVILQTYKSLENTVISKITFFPPNTTSVLQPLDLGIIKNFKVHYRKLLIRHVLAKIKECSAADEVVKSVTILNAIRWVAQGWECVLQSTVQKKAGILSSDFTVLNRANLLENEDWTRSLTPVTCKL